MKILQKYKVELVRESSKKYDLETKSCSSPWKVCKILNTVLRLDVSPTEKFVMLALDTQNNVIGIHEITQGTINEGIISPRDIFQRAILNNAKNIIVAHNHPSGHLKPSQADINVTRRLVEAGKLLDIKVHDHIIVSYEGYFSFKEDDLI